MANVYARVYVLDLPLVADHEYTYAVPAALTDEVHRGSFVTVPFGGGNRQRLALVTGLAPTTDQPRVKPLISVSPGRLELREKEMQLALRMKEQLLCTVGDAVRAMVPASALMRMTEIYRLSPDADPEGYDPACPEDGEVLAYLRAHPDTPTATLRHTFGASVEDSLWRLRRRRLVVRDAEYKDVDAARYTMCRRLAIPTETADRLLRGERVDGRVLRSEKQMTILRTLLGLDGMAPDKVLCEAAKCTTSVLTTMTRSGLLAEEKQQVERNPYATPAHVGTPAPICLNEQQRDVYETLRGFVDAGEAHACLLYGVTGSGKTSVMLALIEHLLATGRGAIVLLPEIALTPQSVSIFCTRFRGEVAVIHSGLSAGERYDAYCRIREGKCRVVLGTRSAVFAPVENLGAIIIDEEQEHTYKSDSNPKYRAHDIARFRCAGAGALLLLASATPSLESYYKATEGSYTLLRLTERFGGATLPEVLIADTRGEAHSGNVSPLGGRLCEELTKNQTAGEQSILFLNRRGYHKFVSCRKCGKAILCERCSVAMTYHTRRGSYDEGELLCHTCGARRPVPATCPECGSPHLMHNGYGTQRVEQELGQLLPEARVLRMDTDTTSTKFAYDRMLGQFRSHEADILLGTQMVTKGHDFPDVTLVGVLSADSSLYLDDYRAAERTFALLTQVIGRAGRGKRPGRAVIQTANPDHEIIRLACAQDYDTFYRREIALRRLLVFPPFCDIALLTLSCEDEKTLLLTSRRLYEEVEARMKGEFSDVQLIVFGPFEAPVYRADNRYRMRMVFKCRLNRRSRALFSSLLLAFPGGAGAAQLSVDFNPSSL